MTAKAAFKQVEIERILKAAQKCGGVVEIDLRSMKVFIVPGVFEPGALSLDDAKHLITSAQMARDGKENWDDTPEAHLERWVRQKERQTTKRVGKRTT
jgi:hypothetical protein